MLLGILVIQEGKQTKQADDVTAPAALLRELLSAETSAEGHMVEAKGSSSQLPRDKVP